MSAGVKARGRIVKRANAVIFSQQPFNAKVASGAKGRNRRKVVPEHRQGERQENQTPWHRSGLSGLQLRSLAAFASLALKGCSDRSIPMHFPIGVAFVM
jgi:hypothetical protein